MDFPSIANPVYPITITSPDVTIRGQVENITILTRKRVTRVPKTFILTWTHLPTSDYNLLSDFHDQVNGAVDFNWVYPAGEGTKYDGKTFRVRFNGELKFQGVGPRYMSGSINLEEV